MKRDFYQTLLDWKTKDVLTPLMVVGARQIGKTYIIDKFCRENFSNYIYLNLLYDKHIVELFSKNDNLDDIIQEFKVNLRKEITEDTVIFVDEVQESEDFISALKFFCEDVFPYKIIVAGSLLGVKLKRFHKSFPVGKVAIRYMYPISFKEFLIAIGAEQYIPYIEESYLKNKPINDVFHRELLKDYRDFLCTGGMPKMILEYINNNYSIHPSTILKNIIDSYLDDMKKYVISMPEANKIERIYTNIPVQLAKENKKYQFSKIGKNARYRDYETAFEWLLSSRMIIPSYYVNNFETPLKVYMDEYNFKVYLSDVGLLTEMLGFPYSSILLDQNFMFKGSIAENYVASELAKNEWNLFYYQKPQVMEVDFLLDTKDGIIPIEVKASDNVKSTSLNKFMKEEKLKLGYRISTKNFGLENGIKSIPLYAVFCIKK